MTKIEFIEITVKALVRYYIDGMTKSIRRNQHLTGINSIMIADNYEIGILVDIINNIAMFQSVDYAMNVNDFIKEVQKIKSGQDVKPIKTKPDNVVDLNL